MSLPRISCFSFYKALDDQVGSLSQQWNVVQVIISRRELGQMNMDLHIKMSSIGAGQLTIAI